MNQKGFAPILIVLILAALVGGYFIFQNQPKPTPFPQPTTQPSPTSDETVYTESDRSANWKTYTNTQYGYSLKYPSDLYIQEFSAGATFTIQPYAKESPAPLERIEAVVRGNYINEAFNALFKASAGDDVLEAHHAVDVKVTKIRNLKFGNYNAVEFIRDGTIPSTSGLGRGPIGYEHKILIKKNDQEFIELLNDSTSKEKTKAQDGIFDQILSTFKFLP